MLNQCNFIGNVGKIETKTLPQGQMVSKFSLAVNHNTKAGKETLWLDVVAWDKLAQLCETYLSKGKKAFVTGRLTSRTYDNKEGQKVTRFEIVASSVIFLTPKDEAQQSDPGTFLESEMF